MAENVTVLVVGAGPTGLFLAGELVRRGVPCRLIDAEDAPRQWDRATVVHPRSLELAERLGLLDRFLARGVRQRFIRLHSDGTVLGEIDLALGGSRIAFNIGISEQVTEEILTDHLRALGGEVVRSSRLVRLEPGEDGATATVERGGAREEIRAEWVVACDGLHSLTRDAAGMVLEGHDITTPWAVFDAAVPGWPEPFGANYAYLDDPLVILTSLPGERWRVYVRPTGPDSDLVADAASTLVRYHPGIALTEVTDPARFHCHTRVADRYRAGRVLLAGDAAHVCSPSEGHGMNSGVQDAWNLGWKLALVCRGAASAHLLDSYGAERRPVARMITRSGDDTERTQTLRDPAARRERDIALRRELADPEGRRGDAVAEAEMNIDYADSPIVCGASAGALGPGERLPDTIAVTTASGERRTLHELTWGAGHTLVLVGGASARAGDLTRAEAEVARAADAALVERTLVVDGAGPDAGRVTGATDGSGATDVTGPDAGRVTDVTGPDAGRVTDVTGAAAGSRATGGPGQAAGSPPADGTAPRLRIDGAALDALGLDGVTVLAVRPDGHLGLVADRDHGDAVARYQARLVG